MAKNILDQKVGEFNLIDGALITLSKVSSEALLNRFVGNGNLKSGVTKTVGAVVISMISKNKYLQYLSSGLLIDGVEDIIYHYKNKTNKVINSEVIL